MTGKSKREIEMDFQRAISQAQELENLADRLSRIANGGVGSALLVLKNSWMGDAGKSIELEGSRTAAEIFRTADELMKVSKNIRMTADIVYKAEKAAQAICY